MLMGTIIAGLISFFLNSYYTGIKLGYSSWMQLRDVAPSYGIASAISISVYFIKFLPLSLWIVLPLQFIVGSFVFFFLCESSKLPEYFEVKRIVIDLVKKIL